MDTYDHDDDASADEHPADGNKVAKQSDASDVNEKTQEDQCQDGCRKSSGW